LKNCATLSKLLLLHKAA